MPLLDTVCASCGEHTQDTTWCDHCGAAVQDEQPEQDNWLTVGEVYPLTLSAGVFGLDGDRELLIELRVEEIAEQFVNRRLYIASIHGVGGLEEEAQSPELKALLSQTHFIIEEIVGTKSDESSSVPNSLRHRLRQPVYQGPYGEHQISVYLDNAGITLEELIVLARGQLSLSQVKEVFLAVLEGVSELHEARHAHLRLAPWTVRIFDANARDGFPGFLLQQALSKTADADGKDATESASMDDLISDQAHEFSQTDRTEVHLSPLSLDEADEDDEIRVVAHFDESDFDDALATANLHKLSEASVFESEPVWHGIEEVEPAEQVISVIFDGIDDLYCLEEEIELNSVVMGFSPPEMLGRLRSPIGEAADIFSMGMLLYYLIGGETPPASVYSRYAPALPVRNFRPGFPPGLQGVISRATRPSPQDRFMDLGAMREAFVEACEVMAMRSVISERPVPIMRLASDTHVGVAKRRRNPINQDSVFSAVSDDGKLSLIVVADGVSTASFGSGDLASDALTKEAAIAWEELLPSYLMDEEFDDVTIIEEILNRANQRIVDYVNEHCTPFRGSPHEVMGSTAVVAVLHKGVVTIATLGDSRAYLQRGRDLEQLTIDHNLWTLSILEGVAADSALAMPHGDALARCMGTFVIDQGNLIAVPPQPDFFRFVLTSGDTLLLTTDGLVDFAGANALAAEDNILSVLLAEPDPALCCLELILLANRGGGGDNIGVCVIRFS